MSAKLRHRLFLFAKKSETFGVSFWSTVLRRGLEFHSDCCSRKGSNRKRVIEKISGRDRDRTGDPLLAKQIHAVIEIRGFLLILSDSC